MRQKNLRENESAVAPLLLLLGFAGLMAGGGVVFAIAPHLMVIYFLIVAFVIIGLIALKSGPKTLKMVLPVFVLLIILVLVFSFVPLPWLTIAPPSDFDTEMKSLKHWAIRGKGNPEWEEGGSKDGEGIDSIRYITSYKPEGKSEKLVIQFRICDESGFLEQPAALRSYRYLIYLASGTGWELEEETGDYTDLPNKLDDKCWNTQTKVAQLPHGYSGYVKVELKGYLQFLLDNKWKLLAVDMAYVKEGIVSGEWSKDRYEVGENARFHYKVGWCSSSKIDNPETGGCTVSIYSYGQQKVVKTENVAQNTEGDIDYTVVMADFDTNAGCQNMLKATISNDLIDIFEEYATVIDFAELGPSKPTVKTDKPSYTVGDSIQITIEANENPETKLPIEKYHLRIFYTDPQVIMEEKWITTTTYTFSGTAEPGTIAIEVFCQDEGCRPSEITTKFVKVYAEGDPRGDLPLPWILILLLLVMLILGIAIIYFVKGVPMIFKAIIFIILLLIPVALYFMGVIY